MINEKDQALAEESSSATQMAEASNAEAKETVSVTFCRAERAAEIEVDMTQFDEIDADSDTMRANVAKRIDKMYARIDVKKDLSADIMKFTSILGGTMGAKRQMEFALVAIQIIGQSTDKNKPDPDGSGGSS